MKSSSGQVREYVKIVENVRENGKARQRVIANLGNKAVLSQEIKKIVNGSELVGHDRAVKMLYLFQLELALLD